MSIKKVLPMAALLFIAGTILADLMFTTFADLLLPKAAGEYTLIATQLHEVFITRLLFSLSVGLAFSSATFASWFTSKNTKQTNLSFTTASFIVVMVGSMVIVSLYYKNHFAALFSALDIQPGTPIALDTIPYCQIPLIGAVVTCVIAIIYKIYKTKNTPS